MRVREKISFMVMLRWILLVASPGFRYWRFRAALYFKYWTDYLTGCAAFYFYSATTQNMSFTCQSILKTRQRALTHLNRHWQIATEKVIHYDEIIKVHARTQHSQNRISKNKSSTFPFVFIVLLLHLCRIQKPVWWFWMCVTLFRCFPLIIQVWFHQTKTVNSSLRFKLQIYSSQ